MHKQRVEEVERKLQESQRFSQLNVPEENKEEPNDNLNDSRTSWKKIQNPSARKQEEKPKTPGQMG